MLTTMWNTETGWSGRGSKFDLEYLESWLFHMHCPQGKRKDFKTWASVPNAVKVKYDKEWKVFVSF